MEKEIKIKIKGIKGEDGYTPVKGKDYFDGKDGITPTKEEIKKIITPLIPKVKDGKDYILKSTDKKEIASLIKVPVVEKVIEKTEVIKEVALKDTPRQVKEKLLKEGLDYSEVKNTPNIPELVNKITLEVPTIVRNITKDLVNQDVYWSDLKGEAPEFGGGSQNLQEVTDIGSTTTNTITVDSLIETTPTLFKLDQTTPQTTIGEFLFPKLGIGGTTHPFRGRLDILGEEITIADVTTSNITTLEFSYGPYINYVANGDTYTYSVYAYKDVAGTRIYSQNPLVFSGTDDGSTNGMYFTSANWDAVPDALGYRVIVTDPTAGAYDNYYFDTPYTDLSFGLNGVGYDDISGQFISFGNDIVLKSATSGEDYYTDSMGNLIVGNGIITSKPITSKTVPTFTYTDGTLTGITYEDGTTKTVTYNVDGTLNTLTINYVGKDPIVKTMVWNSGVLTNITIS